MGLFDQSDHEQRLRAIEKMLVGLPPAVDGLISMINAQAKQIAALKQISDEQTKGLKELQALYLTTKKQYAELLKEMMEVGDIVQKLLVEKQS